MSEITVAAPRDLDEMKDFLPVHRRTYLMSPEDGDQWAEHLPLDTVRIARRGDRMIGGMVLRPMGQWFGGRPVAMTGISAVGVDPAERASGAGTAFMSEVIKELHAQGTALSSLYPATQTVYRRCGYELAGDHIRYTLSTDHIDVRERTSRVELTEDHETIKSLYVERARRTAGVLDRTDAMWERVFKPWKREADSYLVLGTGGPEGYIVYNRTAGEAVRGHVWADVVALTPVAVRRILTFVADHRSFIETFNWNGPPADPFTFALSEPRRRVELSWPWMLRVVDVRTALSERGYPRSVEAELHLRVRDELLPGNDGAFVLRVVGGKAEVTAGGEERLAIDIGGLAPLYTGYMSPHELLVTGYLEAGEEDLLTAASIFGGPAPWLPDFF